MLEIGCGGSVWLPYFHREFGLAVTGIDYSEPGLDRSRSILAANGIVAPLMSGDVFDHASALAGAFDVVFSLGFIEHFGDPQAALQVAGSLLRPGGLLLTWIPNTAGAILQAGRMLNRSRRDIHFPIDLARLVDMHRSLGMDILASEHTQFLDLTHLGLAGLPPLAQKSLSYVFRGANLILIGWQRAVASRFRSRFLCSGIFVAAGKRP